MVTRGFFRYRVSPALQEERDPAQCPAGQQEAVRRQARHEPRPHPDVDDHWSVP